MTKMSSLFTAIGVLILIAAVAPAPIAAAGDRLVMTEWPSADDPGMPFYARVEPLPPHIFNDGKWAAIVFYRDTACVPQDFNLITFFDFGAFSCPHTVHGYSLWHGSPFNGAPKKVNITGNGAVPVWFVPWEAVKDEARADGNLTIAGLEQIEGLRIGYADLYHEELQPHPDPSIGGGGHPAPKMIVNARGLLEDGGRFTLHIAWVKDVVRSIRIELEPAGISD
jgi:hypothetical protein